MEITFLGNAAAPAIPMPYCDCPTCTYARKHQGKNILKRCSYLINDDLLVDMGPDLFTACALHNGNLLKTKYALVSHSHLDHFFTQSIKFRAKKFHQNAELPPLTFVAPPSVMTLLYNSDTEGADMELPPRPILPYDSVDLPPYHVKAIKSTHFPAVGDAVNYLLMMESEKF